MGSSSGRGLGWLGPLGLGLGLGLGLVLVLVLVLVLGLVGQQHNAFFLMTTCHFRTW